MHVHQGFNFSAPKIFSGFAIVTREFYDDGQHHVEHTHKGEWHPSSANTSSTMPDISIDDKHKLE